MRFDVLLLKLLAYFNSHLSEYFYITDLSNLKYQRYFLHYSDSDGLEDGIEHIVSTLVLKVL